MRCQWIKPDGQCENEAVNGTFCVKCQKTTPEQSLRHYHITNSLVGDPERPGAINQLLDLREEVTLTRRLIETRLNLASSEAEFIASMGILHQYLATVEKLVASCHRMDNNLGNVLNKASILNLAQELVTIIVDELEGVDGRDEIVDRISHRLVEAIGSQSNSEKKK